MSAQELSAAELAEVQRFGIHTPAEELEAAIVVCEKVVLPYAYTAPEILTEDERRTISAWGSVADMFRTARSFYGAGITGPEIATLFAEHALQVARAINEGSL